MCTLVTNNKSVEDTPRLNKEKRTRGEDTQLSSNKKRRPDSSREQQEDVEYGEEFEEKEDPMNLEERQIRRRNRRKIRQEILERNPPGNF